jgi:hypothetical protein
VTLGSFNLPIFHYNKLVFFFQGKNMEENIIMKKGAVQAGGKCTIDGSSYSKHGVITASIMAVTAFSKGKGIGNKVSIVCKADLISLANEEETRKSEVLIDSFINGEITNNLLSLYR